MTKPLVIIHKLPNINANLPNYNEINGNDIITYDQSYDFHGKLTVKIEYGNYKVITMRTHSSYSNHNSENENVAQLSQTIG